MCICTLCAFLVHEPHEEFWLWFLVSPTKIASEKVPATFQGDIHIEKKMNEVYDRGANCHQYNETFTFLDCAKAKVREKVLAKINCTIPDLEWGLFESKKDLAGKAVCATPDDRFGTGDKAGNEFALLIQNLQEYNCSLPCTTTYYTTRYTDLNDFTFIHAITRHTHINSV